MARVKAHSLVFRLAALQQVLAAALILVFAASTVGLAARTLERQEEEFLSDTATRMAADLSHELGEGKQILAVATEAVEQDAPPGVRVEVLDADGHRVAWNGRGRSWEREQTLTRRAAIGVRGWVVVTAANRTLRSAISALVLSLAFAAVPLFVLVTVLSRSFASRALRPLSRMAEQADEATQRGDLRPVGGSTDPREIAQLAEAFNRLLARVQGMLASERAFAQDAAHELRTPLTVISGELERAVADPALPPRQRESLSRAWEQARGMSELVEALLLLRGSEAAAAAAGEPSLPVNLGDVLRDAVREQCAHSPERAHDVEVRADDEVLVAGHATLLASAVRNLLSNACKFSSPGQPVHASAAIEGDHAVLFVEDAGPGIPETDLDRVFDPFYRGAEARAASHGFGLGLAMLRRVARAHGGEVTASASGLGGARFELTLPRWKPAARS